MVTNILIFAVIIVFLIVIGYAGYLILQQKRTSTVSRLSSKNNNSLILQTLKQKLASNPQDYKMLLEFADLSYSQEAYADAYNAYQKLFIKIAELPKEQVVALLDLHTVRIRAGISALKIKNYELAYQMLSTAFSSRQEFDLDLLLALGQCEYYKQSYDKAIQYLKVVLQLFPDNPIAKQYVGLSFYKLKKYIDAINYLKSVSTLMEEKEVLYYLASAYYESNDYENAIKYFSVLKSDVQYGSASALFSGNAHFHFKRYNLAIDDYQLGLAHANMRTELMLELKYRMAHAEMARNNISKALRLFQEVKKTNPSFRNVANDLKKYSEHHNNKAYSIYMTASQSEVVILLKKLTPTLFNAQTKVKIEGVYTVGSSAIDILVETKISGHTEIVLLRFFRIEATLTEDHVRDFYNKMKLYKASKGMVFTSSAISNEAKLFVEARLIDLHDKDSLLNLFKNITI